jgi:regulator of RNase E activity RraA
MRLFLSLSLAGAMLIAGWLYAQPAGDSLIEGYRLVEVASVADAMEQLYGQRAYMAHDMRPLFKTKLRPSGIVVMMKKVEHKEGSSVSQGMLDAIDAAPPGSVYVMVLEDGLDIAGIGGLMATAMKVRGLAGAVLDAGVRDLPQIHRLQFPVYSRAIAPATSVNHYKFAGSNIPAAPACASARATSSRPTRTAWWRRGPKPPRSQEGAGTRRYGAQDVSVHREV